MCENIEISPSSIGSDVNLVTILPDGKKYSEQVDPFQVTMHPDCSLSYTYEAFLSNEGTRIPVTAQTNDTEIAFDPITREFTFKSFVGNQTIPIIVRLILDDPALTANETLFNLVIMPEVVEEFVIENTPPSIPVFKPKSFIERDVDSSGAAVSRLPMFVLIGIIDDKEDGSDIDATLTCDTPDCPESYFTLDA